MNRKEENFLRYLPQIYFLLKDAIIENNFNIHFYNLCEIYERNITFEIDVYAENYIAFADDNGDKVYLISKSNENHNIYMSDIGESNIDETCVVASSVEDFISRFSSINDDEIEKYCDINWINLNNEAFDTKCLLDIKKTMKLSNSVGEILMLSKHLPQIVKRNIRVSVAEKMLLKLDGLASMFEIIEK